MMRPIALLLCWFVLPLPAQEAPKPPAAIASLAKLLGKKARPPVTDRPTRFKPNGKPAFLYKLADALGQDDDQKAALREVLVAGVKGVEERLAGAGYPNDVAAGLAFTLAYHWGLWKETEVSDPASEALLAQLHGALDTAEFRALSDLEKQKAYEYAVGLGVFTLVLIESSEGDKEALAGARVFARTLLETLLGADPGGMDLTDAGLVAAAGAGKAVGAPLVIGTPAGWIRETADGMVVLVKSMPTRNDQNEPLTVRVFISTGGALSSDIEKDLHASYDKMLRPLIPADATSAGFAIKDARPDVCRRYVGNGLRCQFAGVSWSKRDSGLDYSGTSQELHLYLVESGGAWFPVVVQLSGLKGPVQERGEEIAGAVRHEWLETMWAQARGEASTEPLFAAAELVGNWELSSSTGGPFYYIANTGASLGTGMVVRNHKVELRADGTWTSVVVGGAGIGTTEIQKQTLNGKWQVKNDRYGSFLVRSHDDRVTRNRLIGLYTLPDARRVYVELLADDFPALPVLWQNGDRYLTMPSAAAAPSPAAPAAPSPGSVPGRYRFTSTTFDDGWLATAAEGWTEVRKGSLRVMVHYPNPQADAYNSVLRDGDVDAWNVLVNPRYTNLRNFEWKSVQSWESITFLHADAVERATGRNVYVVLFKKHSSLGNGRFLEFIAESRAAHEAEFGAHRGSEFGWEKMADMQFRNRFAVAAGDLIGKWGANDYASLQYYYVNTGGNAGATATSTSDQFTFLPRDEYESDHSGASGVVGNMKFSRVVYKGKSTVSDWQLVLTNRFQGATETYQCAFEGIRGGRILVLTDARGSTWSLVRVRER